jgi:hypothetical protein
MKCYMNVGPQNSSAPLSPPASPWNVVITEWALDSYLNLKHAQVFSDREYWTVLRPDVELLKGGIPSSDPKFSNSKFWGPAKLANVALANGYKMKWHQIGSGKVQLRLPVTAGSHGGVPSAFLCECYVKSNTNYEQRMMAKFKRHMNLIALNRYTYRGAL